VFSVHPTCRPISSFASVSIYERTCPATSSPSHATRHSVGSASKRRRPASADQIVHVAREALVPERDVADDVADRPRVVDENIGGRVRRGGCKQPLDSRVEFGEQGGARGQLRTAGTTRT
jgi:hypothetical protein